MTRSPISAAPSTACSRSSRAAARGSSSSSAWASGRRWRGTSRTRSRTRRPRSSSPSRSATAAMRATTPAYQRLLQTTLEVVEEEVGTLRRLVGEFSISARLPRARAEPSDLAEFLREQGRRFAAVEESGARARLGRGAARARRSRVRRAGCPDAGRARRPEMLRRALGNIVRNAAQALRDAQRGGAQGADRERPGAAAWGRVRVSARSEGAEPPHPIDDDGPGIDPAVRDSVFDPYVTTRYDGTGLGLEHREEDRGRLGGTIDGRGAARRRALRHPAPARRHAGGARRARGRGLLRRRSRACVRGRRADAAALAAGRRRAGRGRAAPAGARRGGSCSAKEPHAGRRARPGSALRAAGEEGLGAESAPRTGRLSGDA